MTDDEREAAFQRHLESTVNYFAAIEAAGDKPWFSSVEERRELFMRRYKTHTHPRGRTKYDRARHHDPRRDPRG
jgi:hypothetical protein